jgi:hypothetical protein
MARIKAVNRGDRRFLLEGALERLVIMEPQIITKPENNRGIGHVAETQDERLGSRAKGLV